MSRSRHTQYIVANAFREPIVAMFGRMPKCCARLLLRTFRWSDSFVGYGIRYLCVRRLAKRCGKKVLIFPGCMLFWLENCEIGENVTIHDFCYVDGVGGVVIGDNVRIAHNCSIISGQHRYDVPGKTIFESGYVMGLIEIGSDVWLATGAVVTPGVKIGQGAVIGANSVVTKDVQSYSVTAGIPARFLKHRFGNTSGTSGESMEATGDG